MSEMSERVAGAMQKAGDAYIETGIINDWRDMPLEVLARVAIETMREPTEAMERVGADMEDYRAVASYQAMIDEALK